MFDTFVDSDAKKAIQVKCFARDKKDPLRQFKKGENIKRVLKKKGQWDLKIGNEWKKRSFPMTCTFTAFYMDPDAMLFAHVKDGVFVGIDGKPDFPLFDEWGHEHDKGSFARRMFLHIFDHEYCKSVNRMEQEK